jgi:hypothetical protein
MTSTTHWCRSWHCRNWPSTNCPKAALCVAHRNDRSRQRARPRSRQANLRLQLQTAPPQAACRSHPGDPGGLAEFARDAAGQHPFVEHIGEVPPVLADAGELHQVVVNLVTNAAQAIGGEVGRITVIFGAPLRDSPRPKREGSDQSSAYRSPIPAAAWTRQRWIAFSSHSLRPNGLARALVWGFRWCTAPSPATVAQSRFAASPARAASSSRHCRRSIRTKRRRKSKLPLLEYP